MVLVLVLIRVVRCRCLRLCVPVSWGSIILMRFVVLITVLRVLTELVTLLVLR